MIAKTVLDHAKAYLCWDRFPDLSIQLVALRKSVGYFYPPTNKRSSILLFYNIECRDFKEPLFFLFHEVGHYCQYCEFRKQRKLRYYQRLIEAVEGNEKYSFETQAWKLGLGIFKDFLHRECIPKEGLLLEYSDFSEKSVRTYLKQ